MSLGRKKVATEPDILEALGPLNEIGPASGATSGVSTIVAEVQPPSGAVLVSSDGVVRLPFSLGEVIAGKYEVIGLLGAGGVGYVVSAMHLELGEMVALKFLREESMAHEQVVLRFAREARAAARIKSEYVARVYDVGSLPNGVPFIVMEHLHGRDLADVIRAQGRLTTVVAVEHLMQACEALASAHSVGIVHRDIKPENLFLSRQAEGVEIIKVLDFGISKVAVANASHTPRQFVKTMMPMGTPAYMSPEQIRATSEVDARADIWALGCVLFELLTGACAFDAPTLMQLGAAILEREPVPLRRLLPEAPAELEAIISRCLEKDVEKRYQNVAELAIALYPFAPRRARLQAERTSNLLNSMNPLAKRIELTSVAPPTLAAAAEAPSIEVNARSFATTLNPDEIEAMRPRRKRNVAVALVSTVLALGGASFYLVESGTLGVPSRPGAAAPAPAAAALTPTLAPKAASALPATGAPSSLAGVAPAAAATPLGSAPRLSAPKGSAAKTKPRAAKPRPPGAPRSTNHGDDDEDVGY
jgi:serine/threonine protein kinase